MAYYKKSKFIDKAKNNKTIFINRMFWIIN